VAQSQIKYPLNDETITSIKAFENIPDELAAETAQAIQVVFNLEAVYEQGALDAALAALRTLSGSTLHKSQAPISQGKRLEVPSLPLPC
jgi:hypothetical protein